MLPYIFAYTISLFFIFLSQKAKNNRILMILFSVVSLFSICIFSGLRDFQIGRDITTYGLQVFNGAMEASKFSTFSSFQSGGEKIEIGYLFFNFIISKVTNSMHVFLFLHAILVNGLSFIALFKLRRFLSFTFLWFSYLMLVYPYTLTMLRQSLALSLVFLSLIMLLTSKKYFKAFLLIILALTMHNSAFVGLILFLVVSIFNNKRVGRKGVVTSLIVVFILANAADVIVPSLINQGYISNKFAMYDGGYASSSLLNPILIRLPLLFLLYFSWWRSKEKMKNSEMSTLAYLAVLEVVLQPIKLFDYNVARIIWYLNYFMGIGYAISIGPIMIGKRKYEKKFSIIIATIVLLYIGLYSNIYQQNINVGGLGLYPYTFFIQQ